MKVENARDQDECSQLNRDFHTAIVLACHNRALAIMWPAISDVADGQGVGSTWDESVALRG